MRPGHSGLNHALGNGFFGLCSYKFIDMHYSMRIEYYTLIVTIVNTRAVDFTSHKIFTIWS